MKTAAAQAAAMIRKHLKAHGVAATVRSRQFAGGSSVDVTLTGAPLPATVEAVTAFVKRFEMGSFDGMRDLYEYDNVNADLPQAKFVMMQVEYDDEVRAAARQFVEETFELDNECDVRDWTYRVLRGTDNVIGRTGPTFRRHSSPRVSKRGFVRPESRRRF